MKIVPITGDDLREVLSLGIQKQEVSFDAPKFITLRIHSDGQNHDFPLRHPATARVTVMVYFPAHDNRMQFWVTTDDQLTLSSYLYFHEKQGNSTRTSVKDGVYTIQGAESEEDAEKHPAWKLEVLASDQASPAENAGTGQP